MKSPLKHWLVLTRCSNLPTVWSNLISGWLLGLASLLLESNHPERLKTLTVFNHSLIFLLLGISLLYTAGMILNDVFDYEWDVIHRPERPLPSGHIKKTTARDVGYFFGIAGIYFLFFSLRCYYSLVTVRLIIYLVILILWYNLSHKNKPFAPVVMGGCRFLLPLIGFNVVTSGSIAFSLIVLTYALILGFYTFALTWLAKYEYSPAQNNFWMDRLLYLIPLPLVVYGKFSYWSIAALFFYYLWMGVSNHRHRGISGISARVADRIAAFSLLDLIISGVVLSIITSIMSEGSSLQLASGVTQEMARLALIAPPLCLAITLSLRKFIPST